MSTRQGSSSTAAKLDDMITIVDTHPPLGVTDKKAKDLDSSTRLQDPTSTTRKTDDWWIWEILGVMGSALAIVAIGVLLFFYNRKPVPNWSYTYRGKVALLKDKAAHVSFNAILAILSTVARICLLIPITKGLSQLKWVWFAEEERILTDLTDFEAASRQSLLQSVKLVWRLKGRHFAVIGAVAVIFIQGFDFFVQNLVTYSVLPWADPSLSKPLPPNSEELFARWQNETINNPDRNILPPPELQVARIANAVNYPHVGYGPYYSVDTEMKANIWAALYATDPYGNWASASYICSTGNCTWPNYSSLGVCARCSDLTPKLTKSCTPAPGIDPAGVTGCDVSLPNGFSLGGVEKSRYHIMAMNTSSPPLAYTNYSSPIAIIQSITAYNTSFVNSSTPISASECALVPCVLNYDNTTVDQNPDSEKFGFNGALFQEYAGEIWDNLTIDNTQAFPRNGPTINVAVNASLNGPSRYSMNEDAYLALKYYIEALLSGFVSVNGSGTLSYQTDGRTQNVKADSEDAMQAIYQPIDSCFDVFGNSILDWNICSINLLSIGMTKIIRDNSFNFTANSAIGVTVVYQPTILVAWLWIIPAGVLWIFSLIMLIGTAWKTHRSGVRTWRGNPLALVFLRLGDKEQEMVKDYGLTEEGLHKTAKALQVQLRFTDKQAQLVQG